MIDFIEYVVSQLRSKQLSKADALALMRQFSLRTTKTSILHPLLHSNTSDLRQQSYASIFTGNEFFLRDHRVQGRLLLPGAAYLEMARAAVAQALPDCTDPELHNVVWAQPMVVSEPTSVAVALFPDETGEWLDFEIYGDGDVVHCQGRAAVARPHAPSRLDIEQLKAQMSRGRLEAPEVYAAFESMGVDFGPALRSIVTIHQGEQQVLAELQLPAAGEASLAEYRLHPTLLDGALQACIGLAEDGQARLPFALECLRIASDCTARMYAWVRSAPGGKLAKLDIDLCDEQGNVAVELRGFSPRLLDDEKTAGVLLAAPAWQAQAIETRESSFADHHVILCDLPNVDGETLGGHCLSLHAERDATIAQRYSDHAVACFERIQSIVRSKPQGKTLIQIVVADPLLAGLSGLLRTAALESPQLAAQLIVVEPETTAELLAERLNNETSGALEPQVRYAEGVRQVLRWEELAAEHEAPPIAFKDDGTYLITGGLGGLGTLFTQEILRQTTKATILLTGRSPLTRTLPGERVFYHQVDLTDVDQVERLIAPIQKDLNGILHCAGMIADNFILKKSSAELARVLEPKVAGTLNLDRASRDVDLDFFVLFSALAAMGNPGQADYAAANAFMDQFAAHRNRQVAAKERRGRTLSINWPLWQNGGMSVDAASRETLERTTGMQPMQDAAGIQAFYRSVASPHDQVLVAAGDLARLRRTLLSAPATPAQPRPETPAAVDAESLTETTQQFLRKQLSGVLQLPPQRIDAQAPLEDYGIDSIMAMKLTNRLEETFGSLPKTLFFEYQTIADLAGYFIESHKAQLAALFDEKRAPAAIVAPPPETEPRPRSRVQRRFRDAAPARNVNADAIAIIGLSGRYPEAVDIEAYWQNLREGKDCITEVPKERWDWREYYSEDRTKAGHHYSKWGGFIEGVAEFDPLFFNISPIEAEHMDPQERLFLQHAWMAIEDAGYTRASLQIPHEHDLPGEVGVYAGVMYTEYQLFGAEAIARGRREGVPGSAATIANRVSYALNLHGPSMTLDTMCSSSLTAIHLACEDLKRGRTSLAIAGGVNVSVHPNKYLVLSDGQFISSDGRCQSFGEGGDGYIPGEGVGVVVLKRLAEAERDGDHIYGIIRAVALNHGGKTNGYSVPNPQAQAAVIGRALAEARVDARHISYVEAHGTGTKLGDPIEIAALSKAFQKTSGDTEFCFIGSVKSNIGHCESAAGIAGLTKILLQMQHRQIVPSLHSAQLNPHIDFPKSPFIVNQTLRPWEPPVVDGRALPRLAGLSSFGAGGSNAHVIVEEYPAPARQPLASTPVAVVLSARTSAQLRQKAVDLLNFVRARQDDVELVSMAYTLQTGREAMDERLGFVASSAEELIDKLQAYAAGEHGEDVHVGRVKSNDEALALFRTDAHLQQAIEQWIVNHKLSRLLSLWVNGLEVAWSKLYGETKPRRMSLPAYPFARERYWIDVGQTVSSGSAAAALHPLLQTNTSDLREQRYSSTFTGEEFFLADHQVNGGKVLPAVAYLEMARAAIERSLPARSDSTVLELHNTVWAQPVVVVEATNVHIALAADDDEQIDFEIYSDDDRENVHCQGRAVLSARPSPERLDLERLENEMSQWAADGVYTACARMGLAYGPSFRAVTAVHRGHGQALAQLRLPSSVDDDSYVLHPSLMDGALQACVALLDDSELSEPRLPFALETLRIVSPCTSEMVAWVRHAAGGAVDIDLCDAAGNVCVQMHGLSLRAAAGRASGSLMAIPVWEAGDAESSSGVDIAEHHVVLCEPLPVDVDRLQSLLPRSRCTALHTEPRATIAQRYSDSALACFERIRTILESKPQDNVLFQLVVVDHREHALLAGLSGLLKTAALENPHFVGQLILVPPDFTADELGRHLREEKQRGAELQVKYERGLRQVLRWREIPAERGKPPIAFKDDGVYLITGGLGGLGLLFAKEIVEQTGKARVILAGRAEKRALPDGLGRRVSYRQLDLGDLHEVERLVAAIQADYGRLDGILHSAGMIADRLIVKKEGAEFRQVLTPKVAGTFHLDQASRDVKLDFFVLFSSVAGAMGNFGQADYAAANGFMDQFAAYRNRQAAAGQRHGRTRSINWPLWQDGGMQIDAASRELLHRMTGIEPMRTATGLEAFHRSLALACDQMLVAEGDLAQMRRLLHPAAEVRSGARAPEPATAGGVEQAQDFLRKEFAAVMKLPFDKIEPNAALEKYGIDSILAMKLTNQLEKTFGSLSKTLFFEYQTVAAMAGYFLKAHPAVLRDKIGSPEEPPTAAMEAPRPTPARRSRTAFRAAAAAAGNDIAIVGLSGRYPQAETLREFWRNLQSGRDCITEIPPERWDHALYYDPDPDKIGKSYSKWGGFIADVDQFDPLFFNISPKEAALIDPQERLFLETAWHAIEDAGYTKESMAGRRVGVFVGVMWGQYELFGAEFASRANGPLPMSSHASVANRVSYFFDFHGPSIALDTMCSSSLTAIHLACEQIRSGAIDAAIAGGVNVTIHPYKYLTLSQGKFAASDGRCRSFGRGGDGYVPGEGVGAVLLKPLEHAVRDGDQIYAVIKSSAVNHGGKTNGYSVPNPNAQGDLIAEALRKGNIDPRTLSYIETHGTGTSLGDPIEITGLLKAFDGLASEKQFCPIGSVKSNIGHLESAAGIAALTKALLQLRYGQLVPSLHADPLNPNIDFDDSPFYVQRELAEWKRPAGHPRRVGVSSFGAGGSNAHLILEEYEGTSGAESISRAPRPELFVLSARTPAALRRYAERVADFLETAAGISLASMAYTSQMGRTAMDARLAIVASSVEELRDKLKGWTVVEGRRENADLLDGPSGKAFVASLLENRELERVARLWTSGADVDWSVLYRRGSPKKISLPPYPFEKERCWIDPPKPAEEKRTVYYEPEWIPSALGVQEETADPIAVLDRSGALAGMDGDSIIRIDPENDEQLHERPGIVLHYASGPGDLHALAGLCKALMQGAHPKPLKIMSVFADSSCAAVSGFLKTLALEDPRFVVKALEIEDGSDNATLIWNELRERDWTGQEIRYRGGVRSVRRLVPHESSESSTLPLRKNGVYLITGGLGGLGLIFAEYLAKQYQAKLILIGRSAPNARHAERLAGLEAHGAETLVLQADVARAEDMDRVVAEGKARFGQIHGVIHAAGVTRDSFLLRKTKEEIDAVLAPKIQGTINVDRATRDENLDVFVLFSSIAGVMGNAGQSDYAFGSRFQDAFAEDRQKRSGRTLSIDWPLWEDGGMRIPPADVALLETQTGISPLPTAEGIRAWEDFLRSDAVQGIAVYGIPSRIAAFIDGRGAKPRADAPRRSDDVDPAALSAKTEAYLKALIGEEISLAADRIGSSDPLESFGLDSVMINRLNARLERDLGALPKTLLYQYETVRELAAYLAAERRDALTALPGGAAVPAAPIVEAPARPEAPAPKERGDAEGIAIIGIHGHYPHSPTLDAYWSNLVEGRDLIDLVPPERWNREELYDPDPAAASEGKIYCKWGGFLDDYDKFDPHFFKIPTAEARLMDPQERLFLESVWAAIEDAGYTKERLRARYPKAGSADVGVFVGVTTNTYHLWAPEERMRGNFVTPSAMPWSIANRVSYFFDFNGPSMPVDTACSSSLVAIHLACESLRSGECRVAVAGGVNLYLHPAKYHSLCERRMVSRDGKCHSYGAGDDGFVPGEGVGTVVLKPLGRAVEDGDRVYAVIRASAWDHSGRSNGYSAPNPNAQANLIARTLEAARVHPETIGYVEGHGTGTQLGDSIEIAALTQAFRKETAKTQFCPIGCVKANVGHSESAAGIASLTKVILQLEHGQLAPSIHSEAPNPNIEFEESPFFLQHALSPWTPPPEHPRRALINSFGAGGVNACVLLEEFRNPAIERRNDGPYLFTLSARSEERLREYASRVLIHLQGPVDLAALCYTLQAGREAMEERLAIVVADVNELVERLSDWSQGRSAAAVQRGSLGPRRGSRRSPKVVKSSPDATGLLEVASKWVAGDEVDWESLYPGAAPNRVGAPTYPFARERYWISDSLVRETTAPAAAQLHPLISCNASTLKEIKFSSSLSDTAFYAVDHRVHDERIFPGAGYLEMACVAANMASEQRVRKIRDVVWIRPLSFRGGPQSVRTVFRNAGGCVEYAISSLGDENEELVHCEGKLIFGNGAAADDRMPPQALKARCGGFEAGAACYEKFSAAGLYYGPSFQTIRELYVNDAFALAKLSVADALQAEFGQFILHPSIIDGALQTTASLIGGAAPQTPCLPFALDEIEILRAVPQTCWAYAERGEAPMQFNLRLLTESGETLVKFTNLYVRPLAAAAAGRLLSLSV